MTNRFYPLFASFLSYMSLKSFLFFIFLFSQSVYATTRIAIVSEPKTPVEDLIVAKLSAEKDIELLERSEISKTLLEQKISATVINETQILSLGKILKTDLFAVIQADEKNIPIGLIVFDAETGVRYWDSAFPETDMDKIAKFAADSIKTAVGKREKSSEGKLKYLSLLSVRNADLPREKDPFCNAVGILLMRQLGNSPDIAVLERSYLEHLNKERNLPGMEWTNNLLSSNVLMELEIRRSDEKIQAVLYLPGEQKISVEHESDDPGKLADSLASEILGVNIVNSTSNLTTDRTIEAKRLLAEYYFLAGHKSPLEALEKIEAYNALMPETHNDLLVVALCRAAEFLVQDDNNLEQSLGYLERAFDVYQKYSSKETYFYCGDDFIGKYCRMVQSGKVSAETRRRVKELAQAYRSQRIKKNKDRFNLDITSEITDYESFERYSEFIFCYQKSESYASAKEWLEPAIPAYEKWLDVCAVYSKNKGNKDGCIPPLMGENILHELINKIRDDRISFDNEDVTKLANLYNKMLAHPVPPIRIAAKSGLVMLYGNNLRNERDYWIKAFKEIAEMTRYELEKLGNGDDMLEEKAMCYNLSCGQKFPRFTGKPEIYHNVGSQLFDFMISRNELSYLVATDTAKQYCLWSNDTENCDFEKAAECSKIVLKLCDSPTTKILWKGTGAREDYYVAEIKRYFNDSLRNIVTARPDLYGKIFNVPWTRMINLTNCKKNTYVVAPLISAHSIYAIKLDSNSASLIKLSIPDGKEEVLSSLKIIFSIDDVYRVNYSCQFLPGNRFILWVSNLNGLVFFPLDGTSKPFSIDEKSGLPSNQIQSFACLEDKIYIATNPIVGTVDSSIESYLFSYDVNTHKLDLITSSRKIEKSNLFDNISYPIFIGGMVADPERSRLLIKINFKDNNAPYQLGGLYEYKPKNETWEKLTDAGYRGCLVKKNDNILISEYNYCFTFNPSDDSVNLIYGHIDKEERFPVKYPKLNGHLGRTCQPPYLVTDNYLWGGLELCRISLETGVLDELSLPKGNNNISFLEIAEDGKYLIVGNYSDLWLLELKDGEK